jgi:TPP-dependent pyruvate/acetoin dehydrogenase alpha subunit
MKERKHMNSNSTSSNHHLELEMIKLRYWQHVMNEELKKKAFNIPIHGSLGNEAVAVAVSNMMSADDQLVLTHRNMAYNLVRNGALKPVFDEYKMSPAGVAEGKLGSMNLTNPARGIVYSSSILGNNYSVGCGLALAKQVKQQPGIVVVMTGDGAMEEGGFYEALVFARSHNLKVMIIIENNNHSLASTIDQRRCPISVEHLCEAVSVPFNCLSGNNVFEYVPALTALRAEMDTQSTPDCVEVMMSLLNQHAGPTPGWPTDPMNVDIKNGLVVDHTPRDPLFVLQQTMGETQFEQMAAQVISKGWD